MQTRLQHSVCSPHFWKIKRMEQMDLLWPHVCWVTLWVIKLMDIKTVFTLFHNTWFLVHCKTNKETKDSVCQTPDPGYKRGTTDSHTEYMEHLHYATCFMKPFCTDIDAPSDSALTFAEPWTEEVQKALIGACQWFSVLAWNCLISLLQFCPQDLQSQQSQSGIQVVFMLTKVGLQRDILL